DRSPPGSSCSTCLCRKSRGRFRFSIAPDRRRAACTNCGFATANTCTWLRVHPTSSQVTRMTISSTAASTCATLRNRWRSGTSATDNVAPPPRHPLDKGYRAHNTNVYPQRPDRLYLCYIDGGMFVMDIKDKASPKVISHWTNSPPYTGFMHTAVPLFD